MAVMENPAKGATPEPLAIGIDAAPPAPELTQAAASILRPAAKAVMRTGILPYRSTAEPTGATVASLVTEAQPERAAGAKPALSEGTRVVAASETPRRQ